MHKPILNVFIDEKRPLFEQMCDHVFDHPELRFQEHEAVKIQSDFLSSCGFSIRQPIGKLDTAFVAEYGSGRPVIAICGEYDALPNLSQQPGIAEKKPICAGGPGHGCGHHLLGTAALEAAYAVSRFLHETGKTGTIRYYGCPAEEGGSGKVRMIQAGAFDDVDAALSWHPHNTSFVISSSTAVVGSEFHFHGKSAHAAANPSSGRSALDAAEIMNIGANFLREHMPEGVSLQYAFLNAGLPNPNIIPDEAAVVYTVRAREKADLDSVFARVQEIARGAALITGTEVDPPKVTLYYSNILQNDTIHALFRQNELENHDAGLTEDDMAEAAKFVKKDGGVPKAAPMDTDGFGKDVMRASADFGDVTQVVPGAAFTLATFAQGTPLHSWSAVAQGKEGYAHKAMHKAAKILAGTAADLINQPELLEKARAEFVQRTGGAHYENPLKA